MTINYNPRIVTSGLVLHLDAANPKSYPGTGTTWNDLSGNRNNGTLINGPTFNGGNGGYIICDGVNDYVEVTERNTNLEFHPLQPYSAFCWVYNLTGTSAGGAIFANMINSVSYQGWDLWINNTTEIATHLISSWSANASKVAINFDFAGNANKWVNVGYTYNGTSPANSTDSLNSINFYVNGILRTTGKRVDIADGFNTATETISYNTSQRFRIASRWQSGTISSGRPVTISNVSIYNRALTAQEIVQNFEAVRGRYGV